MMDQLRSALYRGEYQGTLDRIDDQFDLEPDTRTQLDLGVLRAQILYHLTRYDEALQQLQQIEAHPQFAIQPLSFHLFIQGQTIEIHRKKGEVEEASRLDEKAESILGRINEDEDTWWELSYFYFFRGNLNIFRGNLDLAQKNHERSLELAKKSADQYAISNSYNNLGIIHYDRGNLKTALEYFEQAYAIRKELGNHLFQAQTLNNIGIIYDDWGKLQEALGYYDRSLEIYLDLDLDLHIASAYNNIASIMRVKGELDRALEYFKESNRLFMQIGNDHFIGITLHNIGGVYFDLDDLEGAKSYIREAINLRERIGNEFFITESYFLLLRVHLIENNDKEVLTVATRMRQLADSSSNSRIQQLCQLGESLILKAVPSSKSRVRAQEMLVDLIEQESHDHVLSALALIHLADLLIDELRLYRQQSVLDEINEIADQLYGIGQQQYNIKLIVQVLLLLSRIRIIENRLDQAESLLNQALILSEENSLEFLSRQIRVEFDDLHRNIKDYSEMIEDTDIAERLNQVEIDRYIELIRRNLDN